MTDDREHETTTDDDDLEARLNAFDAKVKEAGAKRLPDVPDWSYKRQSKPEAEQMDHRGLGIGVTAVYALVGAMFLGWAIGFGIDKLAHSSPVGQAIGGLLGAGLGLYYVIRLASREVP